MITKDSYRNTYMGLSTDDWTKTNPILKSVENGDARFLMDTQTASIYDEENDRWIDLG